MPRTLAEVVQNFETADRSITDAFLDTRVERSDKLVAWGQYIDRKSEQNGLYGAAAGVGVLADRQELADIRQLAIQYMLQRYQDWLTSGHDPCEFLVVGRICVFLRAFTNRDLVIDVRVNNACLELIGRIDAAQVKQTGWGFFTKSDEPEIVPTCLVFLAVWELGLQANLTGRKAAMDWLISEVEREHQRLHPGVLALALLTIRRCGHEVALPDQLRSAHRWLVRQSGLSPIAWEEHILICEFGLRDEEGCDEYYVVNSPLLILEYFLRFSAFDLMRPAIFDRLAETASNIHRNRMFVSPFNQRAASRANHAALELAHLASVRLKRSPRIYVISGWGVGLIARLSPSVTIVSSIFIVLLLVAVHFHWSGGLSLFLGIISSIVATIVYNLVAQSRYG